MDTMNQPKHMWENLIIQTEQKWRYSDHPQSDDLLKEIDKLKKISIAMNSEVIHGINLPLEKECELENLMMDLKEIIPKNLDAYLEITKQINCIREVLFKEYGQSLDI